MKFRKLIALMLSVFVMAAMAVVPSFAATDVSSWLEKNVTVGVDDAANINARNTTGTRAGLEPSRRSHIHAAARKVKAPGAEPF